MPIIIVFIIIAAAVAYFGTSFKLGDFLPFGAANITQELQISQVSGNASENSAPAVSDKQNNSIAKTSLKNNSQSPAPTKIPSNLPENSIETFIRYGPLEKEIISDANRVIFEFDAKDLPPVKNGQIVFETMIEGIDKDWQKTFSKERTIDLPLGPGNYTFLVRAKTNGETDATPAKRNFSINISPYFKHLKITNARPPIVGRASLITLSTQTGALDKLDITGWQIKGKNGVFTISQGVEKYNSSNPLPKGDIQIKTGDTIYISGDFSPLADRRLNYRPNQCFGYLTTGSQNFPIPVAKSCPGLNQNRLPRYLSQNCHNYIASRSNCETINSQKLQERDLFSDSACMAFIESNFNYPACYNHHSQDPNFISNQWHIYMARPSVENEIMDMMHDTLYLFDKNGLAVDKFTY